MKPNTARLIRAFSVVIVVLVIAIFATKSFVSTAAASKDKPVTGKLTPPANGKKIRVAFVLTEGATMIDFAGPWEVFQDVMLDSGGKMFHPFELFTVGESNKAIHTSAGMLVVPAYTFADAPTPNIVVVPAQNGAPAMKDWLRRMDKQSNVVMSVCTGAYQLADAGLLNGKEATSHHYYLDYLEKTFPKVMWQRGKRYVQSDDVIYTAGGLSSGIDLALHIVEKYYGHDVAQKTAEWMEYHGNGWTE